MWRPGKTGPRTLRPNRVQTDDVGGVDPQSASDSTAYDSGRQGRANTHPVSQLACRPVTAGPVGLGSSQAVPSNRGIAVRCQGVALARSANAVQLPTWCSPLAPMRRSTTLTAGCDQNRCPSGTGIFGSPRSARTVHARRAISPPAGARCDRVSSARKSWRKSASRLEKVDQQRPSPPFRPPPTATTPHKYRTCVYARLPGPGHVEDDSVFRPWRAPPVTVLGEDDCWAFCTACRRPVSLLKGGRNLPGQLRHPTPRCAVSNCEGTKPLRRRSDDPSWVSRAADYHDAESPMNYGWSVIVKGRASVSGPAAENRRVRGAQLRPVAATQKASLCAGGTLGNPGPPVKFGPELYHAVV